MSIIFDCVEFLGTVADIDMYFSRLDIFALISKSEGFPTVVGQAMLRGLPCVVSNVGDARILLSDPNQLVETENIEHLVLALKFHLDSTRHNRIRLGNRNRQRIQNKFSRLRMLDRYDQLYNYVVND